MSPDDVLLGLCLVIVLAVGAQVLAARLRLPAIVVLLPAGMLAGVATDTVHPDMLLGALYQPFVSLAVGVILFEAGLRLSFADVEKGVHRDVIRLVTIGAFVTWAGVSAAAALLFDGLGHGVPVLIGAVLVVSGPTVVLTLLAFVRPSGKVRSVLTWEGVLIDPIGALLGVLVFEAVRSGAVGGPLWRPGEMLLSIAAGVLVGAAGVAILWLLVRETQRTTPAQTVPVVLMMVVVVLVGADLLRDDAGFVATTLMGMALANQSRIDIASTLEFQSALVQLLIGVLFVLIAASVSPSDIEAVLAGGLGLVAAMVLLVRPLAVAVATWRSGLTVRERAFLACIAPRGIVAGATASAFGLQLAEQHVPGADRILPIAFVAILGTVLIYGLAAGPAARLLGVEGIRGTLVLVVGGNPSARAIAEALAGAGVRLRMWVGHADEQAAALAAGLEADRGRLLVDAVSREVELEDVTDALLITPNHDFNALAAAELRAHLGHGHVFRVAPEPDGSHLLAPRGEQAFLGGERLTFSELGGRLEDGARVGEIAGEDALALFVVGPAGSVRVVTDDTAQVGGEGDRMISLSSP
jgi:NhaP-type Na+/H+ or K+/H+ antiporter